MASLLIYSFTFSHPEPENAIDALLSAFDECPYMALGGGLDYVSVTTTKQSELSTMAAKVRHLFPQAHLHFDTEDARFRHR